MRIALVPVLILGCAIDRGGLGEATTLEDGTPSVDDTSVASDSTLEDGAPADAIFESEPLDEGLDVEADAAVDSAAPDTAKPDTTPADTAKPDTAPPDTGPPDTGPPDTGPPDTGPIDPIYLECEKGTLFGGMALAADVGASGGQWASVPTTAMPWSVGTGAPPIRVELPVTLAAGTWYVWIKMYTRGGDADAMYVGFEGGPLVRFFTVDWNKFIWVGAEGSGARISFTRAAGPTKLYVGAGEPGTGCDRVVLTRNVAFTPP